MATRSRSSKLFLERSGIRQTIPAPHPVYYARSNPAHGLELIPPLPIPGYQAETQGSPPPDRGKTEEWPNGTTEEP